MAKTIKVETILQMANDFFEKSPDDARMERINMQSFVSNILHKTNNYAGFNYLVPYGEPGSDSSRIFFYKHRNL